ncbi:uncharacterized protein LOC106641220 [Copidosoma floridanum]|uniref:uncharacterized protein LOC106641220 n=1 Tax=Copidosoma floridanum TaxID=29053 RepID=UPI0006C954BD|nr:uncharacterized protein LOC106641220 [Copidosoma floridanum]
MSIRPSKLIRSEIVKTNNKNSNLTVQDVDRMRCNVGAARRKCMPKLPKTLSQFHEALDGLNLVTRDSEKFVLYNDKTTNIVLFSTDTNLRNLTRLTRIFLDGTFYCCPRFFKQLITIHAYHNHTYVPLAFFLLPNKKADTYERALMILQSECRRLQLLFRPQVMFVDFELAIHEAIRKVLPGVSVWGCRHHLAQIWWKKIQSLRLTRVYKKSDSEIGDFLKCFFGLPFLDPYDIEDCFTDDLMSIMPRNPAVEDFCDHILHDYVSTEAPFPPTVWSKLSCDLRRTTNECESFHSHVNSEFCSPYPNLFNFTAVLIDVQAEVSIKMRSTDAQSNKLMQEKEVLLKEEMINYKQGMITRLEYIKNVSQIFQFTNK